MEGFFENFIKWSDTDLAHIVIGITLQVHMDSFGKESTKTLSAGAFHAQYDAVIRQTIFNVLSVEEKNTISAFYLEINRHVN